MRRITESWPPLPWPTFRAWLFPVSCLLSLAYLRSLQARWGGKILVFMSALPKLGALALTLRGASVQKADDNAAQTIMQPASKDYAALAGEAAEHQVGSRCICTASKLLISLACCPTGSAVVLLVAAEIHTCCSDAYSQAGLVAVCTGMPGALPAWSLPLQQHPATWMWKPADLSCLLPQVCIDLFVMSRQSCDLATLGTLCKGTCGQLCHYFPWDARLDADQLENDLRWNLQRPQVIQEWAWSAACNMRPPLLPAGAAAISVCAGALQMCQTASLACCMLSWEHSAGSSHETCTCHMCCLHERCWQALRGIAVPLLARSWPLA